MSSSERTNFIHDLAAPQTKNDWFFCSSPRKPTSFIHNHVSQAFEKVLRADAQWEDLSNGVSIVVVALVVVEILLFNCEGQIWVI